jgi:hypothetical protein
MQLNVIDARATRTSVPSAFRPDTFARRRQRVPGGSA